MKMLGGRSGSWDAGGRRGESRTGVRTSVLDGVVVDDHPDRPGGIEGRISNGLGDGVTPSPGRPGLAAGEGDGPVDAPPSPATPAAPPQGAAVEGSPAPTVSSWTVEPAGAAGSAGRPVALQNGRLVPSPRPGPSPGR